MYEYHKEGSATMQAVMAVIILFVGMGIVTVMQVMMGTISGTAYQITEAQIDEITNTTIKNSVKGAIVNAFEASETTSEYTPMVGLAIVLFIVLSLVLGVIMLVSGGMGGGQGPQAL